MSYYVKKSKEEYNNNFISIISKYPEPKYLTTKGFSSVSKISAHSYSTLFRVNWYDYLKQFNKLNELYEYVKTEYIRYFNETNDNSVSAFLSKHKYFTQDLGKYFGFRKIKHDCGILGRKYTKEILEDNFNSVKLQLGRIPSHSEFTNISKIHPKTYRQFFNLSGQVWEDIIRFFITEEELNEFNTYQAEYRKIYTSKNAQKEYIYSNDELEIEFKRIFDYYYENYNVYPSRRLFNKTSKFHDLLYRQRFNKKWSEVCEMYGYKINLNNSRSEKILLQTIDILLNSKHIPQKDFDWLRNKAGNKLRVDGFYQDYDLIIEFDGTHHRKPVSNYGGKERYLKQVENDKVKNQLIPEHGYKLIRIDSRTPWYDINYLRNLLIENNIPVLQQ